MSKLLRKKSTVTITSLLGVIAAGVLLNLLGIQINGWLGLPLYLDNVGTLLSALVGGYLPCVAVGFLTNIINGIFSEYSTFYCVISVFIALAAVVFANKKMLTRFPTVIIAVLTFAFLGGVAGGALTWLIGGFDFGTGYAANMGDNINHTLHTGYTMSNFLSCFLIDLVDKTIVTAVTLLLYFIMPKKLISYIQSQSWYYLKVFEPAHSKNRKRISLRVKVTLLVAIPITLVAASAVGTSIIQFHNNTVKSYEKAGKHAVHMIARKTDSAKLRGFVTDLTNAKGYDDELKLLVNMRDASPEIQFLYVYQITEEGSRVIFDLDTESVEGDEPGKVIPYDDTVKKYKELFLEGKDVPVDVTSDEYGWLVSVYEPLRDETGKTVCYVGADMSMNKLRSEETVFLTKIFSLFIGFLILIRTYAVWMAERFVITPVNTIAEAAEKVCYDTPQTRQISLDNLRNNPVETGDEIEHLYEAYRDAAAYTIRYIDELERKNNQIMRMQNGLVMVLADMVESRDKCTGEHVRKTAAYSGIILRQMKEEGMYPDQITDDFINEVASVAPLHDVGKIAVSDTILNKPGRLTEEEFEQMKKHTTEGGKIIDKAIALVDEETEFLSEAKNIAVSHHEKWDGKGYPNGLKGEEIPLSARVMAVADVFDALVSRRSYKEPFTVEQAYNIIRKDAGTHFDPVVVQAFVDAEEEIRKIADADFALQTGKK